MSNPTYIPISIIAVNFFLKNTSWRLAEQSLGPDAPSGRVWRRSVNDSSSALLQHQAGRSSSHLPRRV